jgi:hypothetical protein
MFKKSKKSSHLSRPSPSSSSLSPPSSLSLKYERRSYLYDLETIERNFPFDCLYLDQRQTKPNLSLNLSNFFLNKQVFDVLGHDFAHCRQLFLNYTVGLSLQRLELIKHFGMLSILHLKGSIVINVEVGVIIGGYTRLHELDISECRIESKALMTMLSRLTILKILICNACENLDDFSLQAIAFCIVTHRHLSTISLTHCSSFSDEGTLGLLTAAPHLLHSIDLSYSTGITSLTLTGFRKRMTQLRNLSLSNLPNNSQTLCSSFQWVAEGCPNLLTLDLSNNSYIDDSCLILIGKRCTSLRSLNLSQCSSITDDGIVGFVDGFLEDKKACLQQFDLSGCVRCSAPTGFAVSRLAKGLKQLKLNCLSQLTAPSMKAIWEHVERLEVFEMSADLRR